MFKGLLTGAIVIAIAMVCWAVETWTDHKFPRHSDAAFLAIMFSLVGAIVVAAYLHFGRVL